MIARIHYPGWEHFKAEFPSDLFGDERFTLGRYWFRGVANEEWALVSSFDRRFENYGEERWALYARMREAFRKECLVRGVAGDVVENESALWALGQHFGLPTRLLDWTDSPYFAAFFAFADALVSGNSQERVAVWALRTASAAWNREQGVQLVTLADAGNVRMTRQSGHFTLARTRDRSLEEYVEAQPQNEWALKQFTIPTEDTDRAMADLETMGVTYARLFDDMGGSARSAVVRALLGASGT